MRGVRLYRLSVVARRRGGLLCLSYSGAGGVPYIFGMHSVAVRALASGGRVEAFWDETWVLFLYWHGCGIIMMIDPVKP